MRCSPWDATTSGVCTSTEAGSLWAKTNIPLVVRWCLGSLVMWHNAVHHCTWKLQNQIAGKGRKRLGNYYNVFRFQSESTLKKLNFKFWPRAVQLVAICHRHHLEFLNPPHRWFKRSETRVEEETGVFWFPCRLPLKTQLAAAVYQTINSRSSMWAEITAHNDDNKRIERE